MGGPLPDHRGRRRRRRARLLEGQDNDNIPDGLDRCPDTPAGVLVDPRGCPKDSDGDQIPDGLDRCSETPRGATVDALGCPGDEDGDGVLRRPGPLPRTPTGTHGDAERLHPGPGAGAPRSGRGAACESSRRPTRRRPLHPAAQPGAVRPTRPSRRRQDAAGYPGPAAAPARNTQVPSAGTERGHHSRVSPSYPGTARLQSSSYVALDSIAEILQGQPERRGSRSARTPTTAAAAADNLRITSLQAEAVRDYLVVKGVAYQQVVSRGYGSIRAAHPRHDPRGRAANRRVEIRPVTTGP